MLTKEEIAEIKAEALKTDEKAKVAYAKMKQYSELIKSTCNKVSSILFDFTLVITGIVIHTHFWKALLSGYRKNYRIAESAFHGRIRIWKEEKLKAIRQDELDEMTATMTPEELKERAFNPPEGPKFKTRVECIESVFSIFTFYCFICTDWLIDAFLIYRYLVNLLDSESNGTSNRADTKRTSVDAKLNNSRDRACKHRKIWCILI